MNHLQPEFPESNPQSPFFQNQNLSNELDNEYKYPADLNWNTFENSP